jgi:hypothetical protein
MVWIGVRRLVNEIARSRQFFPLLQPKAVTSNAMTTDPDLNDDLSSAMGTETLLVHDLVPDGLPASSRGLLNRYNNRQIRQVFYSRFCYPRH